VSSHRFGELNAWLRRQALPSIAYPTLIVAPKPPANQDIAGGTVTVVGNGKKPKWSLFLCPCGCQSVITLPLQRIKDPYWIIAKSKAGRPSLRPSIWRDVGCFSHFIIDDGRVYWCNDTGRAPDDVRKYWANRRVY